MISIEIEPDIGIVVGKIKTGLSGGFKRGMFLAAEYAAGELRREIQKTFTQHTGKLGRSFRATLVEDKGETIKAGAYSDLVYARIQDLGGTITAKRARYLTVPLTEAAKMISRAGGSARDLRNTSVFQHWAFVRSVTIPATGYIKKAALVAAPKMAKALGAEISESIKKETK